MFRELLNASAAGVTAEVAPMLPTTPAVSGGDILNLGVSILIVLAAILILGWLYSRSRLVGGGSELINVVATRALGPKERLLIVEVADQQLLVGMTATAVQTLHVFDKPVCVAEKDTRQAGFAGRLRAALQGIGS